MRIRRARLLVVVTTLIAALVWGSTPTSAQAPSTTDPAEACRQVKPSVVFVGTATDITGDTVTFNVTEVRSGRTSAGGLVEVRYPNQFNARKLDEDNDYLVAATSVRDQLYSAVPTADLAPCGQDTRLTNGARIDTGGFAGVKKKGPRLLAFIGIALVALLVALLLIGRAFDRRSTYAEGVDIR